MGKNVESQTSPTMGTSPGESGSDTAPFLENQTRNMPVNCLNISQKIQPVILKANTDTTANQSGDDNTPLPKLTFSQNEERLLRHKTTDDFYIPASSTKSWNE